MWKPIPGGRQHKATYASDKKRPGSYLIRVEGPHSMEFEGREVPVTRKDNSEQMETLGRGVWTGEDDESGLPVTLYKFESKPKEKKPPTDF